MTITPTPVAPTPVGGTPSAAAGTGGEQQPPAAGFGALLAQLAATPLANAAVAQAAAAVGGPAAVVEGKMSEPDDASAEGGALPEQATAAPAVALLSTASGATKAAGTAVGAQMPCAATTPASASLAETAVRGVAPAAGPIAAADAHQPVDGQPTTSLLGASSHVADETGVVPAPAGSAGGAEHSAVVPAAAVSEEAAVPQPQHGSSAAVTPGTGPSAAAATVTGAAPTVAGAAPSPLLDQVTPVVSRMVSAGEGSHRMVLRLHPADLGEVQLTVTVRGESVDVTVAAGHEARELLAGGSHELRALLDSIGRTAGQITFKDLPGVTQLPQASPGFGAGGQPDAGQSGTSYGDLSGSRDDDRAGRGGSEQRETEGPRDYGGESDAAATARTSGTRGNGAVDVRI
jgi:flagellar hook-length control protein FliK